MAKLTVVHAEPLPPPPARYVLEMSEDEASFMKALFGRVIGDYGWEIYEKLTTVPQRYRITEAHMADVVDGGAHIKVERR